MEFEPAIHRAGNADRQRPVGRDLLVAVLHEPLAGERLRSSAARVESVQALRFRIPDDREQVAADAVPGRLHESESSVRSNGGVHGVSALPHDLQRDLRRERLAGRGHGLRGNVEDALKMDDGGLEGLVSGQVF